MPKRISGGQEPKDTLKPDRTRTGIWRNAHSSDVTMTYFLTPGHLNPSEPTSEIKAVRGRSAILRKDGTTTPVNVHVAGDSVKKGRMHIDDGNFQIEFEDAEGSFITGNVVYEGKPAYFAEGYFYGEY